LNRFEQRSFSQDWVHSPGSSKALGPHQKHRQRIHNELREFLSAEEARETATHVYNLALEIDEEIGRILQDPLVRRLYEYDGQFFTPRGTGGFQTALDGLHLLNWLSDSILEAFFRGREKHFAIRRLLEELGKHAWVAKRRRMNWEESHTLGLVPKEVLEAIIKDASERRKEAGAGPPELSLEERAFFRSFKEQMERQGGGSDSAGRRTNPSEPIQFTRSGIAKS
jgi:hypothetical protein